MHTFVQGIHFGPAIVWAADNAVMAPEVLRDVKGPVSLPPNYLLWIMIAGFLGGAVLAAIVLLRRPRRLSQEKDPLDARPAWEIAYTQLNELEQGPFLREGQFKEYYSRLSGIIRLYFENRFHIRAPEMTTEEFLWSLDQSRVLDGEQKRTLQKFMDSCDIVKFAKYIPRREEAEESLRFGRQLVDQTRGEGLSVPAS